MIGYLIARLSGPLARAGGIDDPVQAQVIIIGIAALIDPIGAGIGAVFEWAEVMEKDRRSDKSRGGNASCRQAYTPDWQI